MNLFVFGHDYTAQRFMDSYRDRFTRICATYRSPEKAEALQASSIVPYFFDGESYDARILDEIARAETIIVSIPLASEWDPVLRHFPRQSRRLIICVGLGISQPLASTEMQMAGGSMRTLRLVPSTSAPDTASWRSSNGLNSVAKWHSRCRYSASPAFMAPAATPF